MEGTMNKPTIKLICLLIFLVIFSFCGCAGGPWGRLEMVENPTEDGLRQNWNEYTVYYRGNLALVYKIKDDRKIILGDSWIHISSEDMMAESQITSATWVKEIFGNNDQIFGYLVHRSADHPNVKIIDENSVQLYYHYKKTSGR
jgi:hypothetical protein